MSTNETQNDKPLFSTPWTGGPRAVAVAVWRDHAIVGHWNRSKQTRIDLTAEQAAELARISVDEFDPLCEQAEAVAVAERLDEMAGGLLGDYTTLLPGR